MVGTDLATIRGRLEALADPDGGFVVACGRTGERPFPVAGLRFPDRETAADALSLATAYRETLARYDPWTPRYDLVVHGTPVPPAAAEAPDCSDVCHDVVGAVFEALSASGNEAAERAVLDDYLAAAEATTDVDDLSVVLLASTADALDSHLAPGERASVLRDAAGRVDVVGADATPGGALGTVAAAGLADTVTRTTDGWRFAAAATGARGPVTLPVAVALLATESVQAPAFTPVADRVEVRPTGGPRGLATAGSE
ncbi:DUF7551 domain-containing protein [Halobacterium rubrum]|uniref:DUF7551 domain-containing protein n=1 Tax=Halobacterium TaxID=2239 RepID=UPI001F1F9E10|nr:MULTISPECIES: hypothetical protein [Halobacterium]MDH5020141.1 hypothetical protein [Halobacterium rubrum]